MRWQHRGEQVGLLDDEGVLPARTMIMAGTPAGTVFQNVGMSYRLKGVLRWTLGLFSEPITASVVESYVEDPDVRAGYLQPKDRVTIRANYLGTIDNEIGP